MAKLACDICGGKLLGRPGGRFECDSCGMEYDTDWAKAKIQEIRGTVKVEGTVQVQGSVQVQGAATAASLTEKVFQDMASGRFWDETRASLNRALEADPNYGDAHLAFAMRFEPDMIPALLAAKTVGAVLGGALAVVTTRNIN